MIEKKKKKKKKKTFFFFFFFFLKAIKFTESAAFCRVGRVTGNNNKFLLGLISTLNGCRRMFALICYDMGTCFYMFEQKKGNFTILYKIHGKLWGDEIINSTHFHIHIDYSRNVLLKNTKIKNFISSLFFIRFTSNFHCLFEMF